MVAWWQDKALAISETFMQYKYLQMMGLRWSVSRQKISLAKKWTLGLGK